MKVLHDQLTSISERYYENIEMPLTKIQKLSENKAFMKMIHSL